MKSIADAYQRTGFSLGLTGDSLKLQIFSGVD